MREVMDRAGVSLVAVVFVLSSGAFGSRVAEAAVPNETDIISTNNSGDGLGGDSWSRIIRASANGRFAVLGGSSTNFVDEDLGGRQMLFWRDLKTGETELVNVSTAGVLPDNSNFTSVAISSNGRYVGFSSKATNLVDGQTFSNAYWYAYVRDTVLNTTTFIATSNTGNRNPDTFIKGISSDGRFVLAYTKYSLVQVNGASWKLAVLDRNKTSDPWIGLSSDATSATANCDSSYVVYSYDNEITAVDFRNGITYETLAEGGNGSSMAAVAACSGEHVAFLTQATNLVPGLSLSPGWRIALYDRARQDYRYIANHTDGQPVIIGEASYTYGVSFASWPLLSVTDDGAVSYVQTTHTSPFPMQFQSYIWREGELSQKIVLNVDTGGAPLSLGAEHAVLSRDGRDAFYNFTPTSVIPGYPLSNIYEAFRSKTGW